MAKERDTQLRIRALLDTGETPLAISTKLKVARSTVYLVKASDTVERKPKSSRKAKLNPNNVKTTLEAAPLKSIRSHAMDLNVSEATIRRNIKKADGKSLVRVERPLLTERIKEMHLQCCQALLNNLKSVAPNRIIIFSDEKTWTVDPVRNRRNDRYLSFRGKIDESLRTLTTTNHPASVMSLAFFGFERHRGTTHLVSNRLRAHHERLREGPDQRVPPMGDEELS